MNPNKDQQTSNALVEDGEGHFVVKGYSAGAFQYEYVRFEQNTQQRLESALKEAGE